MDTGYCFFFQGVSVVQKDGALVTYFRRVYLTLQLPFGPTCATRRRARAQAAARPHQYAPLPSSLRNPRPRQHAT